MKKKNVNIIFGSIFATAVLLIGVVCLFTNSNVTQNWICKDNGEYAETHPGYFNANPIKAVIYKNSDTDYVLKTV